MFRATQYIALALFLAGFAFGTADAEDSKRRSKDGDHWAFQAPAKPEPPRTGHPIDAFIGAALESNGLALAPEADRYSLVRRAHLELIGIPPSPEAVTAFVNDDRPDAYDRLVDELLASPHYGERQAQRWLDAARYADTNGYEKDRPRSIWPYRDWVINAYNDNMPFDQFTVEQFAGDLLPNPTQSQLIATGFHRNAMLNEEGGIDAAEDWYKRTVDRADATGTVYLGLTMSCAQCHDHKYDPISQREYFEFFAFFNDASEDTLRLPDPEVDEKREQIEDTVAELEAMMVTAGEMSAEETERYRAWAEDVCAKSADWRVQAISVESEKGATMKALPDQSVLATGDIPNDDTYTVDFTLGDDPVSAIRLEALPHKSLPGSGPGRGVILAEGDFLLTELAAKLRSNDVATPLSIAAASAGYAKEGREADKALDGRADTGWSIDGQTGEAHAAVFVFEEPINAPGATLRLTLSQDYIHQHTIGRFRVSTTSKTEDVAATGLSAELEARAHDANDADELASDRDIAWHYYIHVAESLNDWRERRDDLLNSRPEYDSTLIMASRETTRPTHMYHRGEFLNPRELVEPAVPAVLHDWPADQPKDRLGFAHWLVDPDNPLMARVTMNRLWQQVFGRGLVTTPEDFGVRGAQPTHPKLLDWLAVEFIDSGWDLKHMHRLMVTSRAFRQDSTVTANAYDIDPTNALLSRGPRFRMSAEVIRDIALEASGLMHPAIGGPSVYPPQPDGVTALAYGNTDWPVSPAPERHRRALYIYWKRTAPFAASMTFDATSRETACVERRRTNTPLQALTLMNDEVFTEAAKAMADRVMTEEPDTAKRIDYAFMLCTSRPPTESERNRIRAFHDDMVTRMNQQPDNAKQLGSDTERAVWTLICRALLNLDETITQG